MQDFHCELCSRMPRLWVERIIKGNNDNKRENLHRWVLGNEFLRKLKMKSREYVYRRRRIISGVLI
jgi:hypothetical protein